MYYSDDQIKIRDVNEKDIPYLFQWWIDKSLNKHDPRPLPTSVRTLKEECDAYCKMFKSEIMNPVASENIYKYYIITNSKEEPIGFINTFDFNTNNDDAELGIFIGDKSYWNKGIASKSMNFIIDYHFNELSFKRIHIETGETNKVALGLFEKLGFTKCGELVEEDGFKFIIMEIINDNLI